MRGRTEEKGSSDVGRSPLNSIQRQVFKKKTHEALIREKNRKTKREGLEEKEKKDRREARLSTTGRPDAFV